MSLVDEKIAILEKLAADAILFCKHAEHYANIQSLVGTLVNYSTAANTLENLVQMLEHFTDLQNYQWKQFQSITKYDKDKYDRCNEIYCWATKMLDEVLNNVEGLQGEVRRQRNHIPSLPETEERQKEKEQKETQKLCGTFKEQKFYENSSACRDYWFDRMIGLKDVQKEIINGFINPAIYPSLFPKRSRGILLYGSPGTGKSLIAKASVNELKRKPGVYVLFYAPTAAELKGKYFGESEKNIRALFECASKAAREVEKQKKADVNNPEQEVKVFAVIFLDEVEAIAGDRSTDTTGLMKTTVNALLQAMNGVDDSLENVSVIAATNYPWQLDSAFLRRFTVSVHVPLPETDDKAELFELEMSNHVNNIVNELDQSKKSQQKQVVDDDKLPVCMRPDNDNRLKWSETKQVLLLPLSGQTAKQTRPLFKGITKQDLLDIAKKCQNFSNADIVRLWNAVARKAGDEARKTGIFYPALVEDKLAFQSIRNLESQDVMNLARERLLYAMGDNIYKQVSIQENEQLPKTVYEMFVFVRPDLDFSEMLPDSDIYYDRVSKNLLVSLKVSLFNGAAKIRKQNQDTQLEPYEYVVDIPVKNWKYDPASNSYVEVKAVDDNDEQQSTQLQVYTGYPVYDRNPNNASYRDNDSELEIEANGMNDENNIIDGALPASDEQKEQTDDPVASTQPTMQTQHKQDRELYLLIDLAGLMNENYQVTEAAKNAVSATKEITYGENEILAALGGFFRKTYGILVGNPASLEKFLDKVVRVYDKSNMVVYDSVTRKMRIVLGQILKDHALFVAAENVADAKLFGDVEPKPCKSIDEVDVVMMSAADAEQSQQQFKSDKELEDAFTTMINEGGVGRDKLTLDRVKGPLFDRFMSKRVVNFGIRKSHFDYALEQITATVDSDDVKNLIEYQKNPVTFVPPKK